MRELITKKNLIACIVWIVATALGSLIIVVLLHPLRKSSTNEPPHKESLDLRKAIKLTEMVKREWEPHGAKVLLENTESSCFVLRAPYFPLGNNIKLGGWPKEQLFSFPPDTPPTSSQFSLWQHTTLFSKGEKGNKEIQQRCWLVCIKRYGKRDGHGWVCEGKKCLNRMHKCADKCAGNYKKPAEAISSVKKNKKKCRTECEKKQGKKCWKKCKRECRKQCDNEQVADKNPPQPPPKDGATIVNGAQ